MHLRLAEGSFKGATATTTTNRFSTTKHHAKKDDSAGCPLFFFLRLLLSADGKKTPSTERYSIILLCTAINGTTTRDSLKIYCSSKHQLFF